MPWILPTRRKSETGERQIDPSAALFRAVMTVMIMTICPWTKPYLGLPADDNQVINKRLERVEATVESLRAQMVFFVQGFNSFRPQASSRQREK